MPHLNKLNKLRSVSREERPIGVGMHFDEAWCDEEARCVDRPRGRSTAQGAYRDDLAIAHAHIRSDRRVSGAVQHHTTAHE